jgi:uncharacterized membrane protein HdeD (DUF308 family)
MEARISANFPWTAGCRVHVAAIRLRAEIKGEWLLILGGLASIILGGVLMSRPGAGALALIQLIAIYAVIFGILLVTLAVRVRRFAGQ